MTCDSCGSDRYIDASGKCSDLGYVEVKNDPNENGQEIDGYIPSDLNIGGDDYIDIKFCLDCGKVYGKFPMSIGDVNQAVKNHFSDGWEEEDEEVDIEYQEKGDKSVSIRLVFFDPSKSDNENIFEMFRDDIQEILERISYDEVIKYDDNFLAIGKIRFHSYGDRDEFNIEYRKLGL